ncbi:hypothetical protein ACFQYP_45690 [Nonomuraea antimicrobica]
MFAMFAVFAVFGGPGGGPSVVGGSATGLGVFGGPVGGLGVVGRLVAGVRLFGLASFDGPVAGDALSGLPVFGRPVTGLGRCGRPGYGLRLTSGVLGGCALRFVPGAYVGDAPRSGQVARGQGGVRVRGPRALALRTVERRRARLRCPERRMAALVGGLPGSGRWGTEGRAAGVRGVGQRGAEGRAGGLVAGPLLVHRLRCGSGERLRVGSLGVGGVVEPVVRGGVVARHLP